MWIASAVFHQEGPTRLDCVRMSWPSVFMCAIVDFMETNWVCRAMPSTL